MIKFHWLLRAFVCLFSCALQSADQKEPLSKQWVALAHDLALGKIGYFHWLPLEIQANIFSRIYPEPTLDDWCSNNLMCVKNFTVPHVIASFDIKGDRLAYMGKKNKDFLSYKPYWIDLKTNDQHSPCFKGSDDAHMGEEVPRLEWCGDAILFEAYAHITGFSEKHLFAVDVFGKCIGSYPLAHVSVLASHDTWKAHPSMPLLVISQGLNQYFFYSINDKVIKFFTQTYDIDCSRILSWSARLPKAAIYSPSESITHTILPVAIFPVAIDYSIGNEYILKSSKGEPYFSPNSNSVYAKHKHGLLHYDSKLKKNRVLTLPENKKNFLLRGVGNFTYLAEDCNTEGHGTAAYSLRSLCNGLDIDVLLTELSNLPPLHKLPSGDDYRLVTIVPDEVMATSTIKIMVPKVPISFQHYCMLNAALEAQKENDEASWGVFDLEENKELVAQTKAVLPIIGTLLSKKAS